MRCLVRGVIAHGANRTLYEAAGRLCCDTQFFSDLAVAALASVVQAKALLYGVASTWVEDVEKASDHLFLGTSHNLSLGTGLRVGEQIDELVRVVVADGAVQRGWRRQTVQTCMFLVELVSVARNLTQRSTQARRTVAGKADQTGLLIKRTANGLADPESCVRGELKALAPIELVDCVLKAQVALLNQVEQFHARRQWVTACDADYEAQVGSDEPVLCNGGFADRTIKIAARLALFFLCACFSTALDDLGELALLLCSKEGNESNFVEILTYRITHDASLNGIRPSSIPFIGGNFNSNVGTEEIFKYMRATNT